MNEIILVCFGIQTGDIESARLEVERIVGVQLHKRHGVWGAYYSNWPAEENSVRLRENWFDYEDDVKAADYDEHPLVLHLSRPTDLPMVEAALSASPLLRAERVPDLPAPPPGYWEGAEE